MVLRELKDSNRWSKEYNISGSDEIHKLGEFRERNGRAIVNIIGAVDVGSREPFHIQAAIARRNADIDAESYTYGVPQADSNVVELVLTETSDDANGDGYADSHVYIDCGAYANSYVVIEHSGDFFPGTIENVGSVQGTEVFRSSKYGDGRFNAGQVYEGQNRVATRNWVNSNVGGGMPSVYSFDFQVAAGSGESDNQTHQMPSNFIPHNLEGDAVNDSWSDTWFDFYFSDGTSTRQNVGDQFEVNLHAVVWEGLSNGKALDSVRMHTDQLSSGSGTDGGSGTLYGLSYG